MRRAAAIFLPLLAILVLAWWRAQGPEPQPASAAGFSAVRAMGVLRGLLAEGVPHPVGTPANARVRDRIVAQLKALDYDVAIQRRFACNASAVCANVENILARQAGARREDAVLLTAHYDSVAAGPGASDDGVGVATMLEVARVLRGRRFRNPVAILITDGEETGLLGAEAFVADEESTREAGVVINVEMRGTYGPSNLFETSRGNRWLIRRLAGELERPQATSLFYEIYNLLPNDTDVTIFKRAGLAAINFAAVRGVYWYHTPLDDLAHVNPRTLQHHGDNVLASVRALADADLDARSSTDATYFDVLAFHLVWWPQEWTLWIAIAGLVLLVIAVRQMPPREMTFGVLTAFAAILFAVLLGAAVSWLARLRSEDVNFVARPQFSIAAMGLIGIAAALLAAALFRARAQPRAMLYGIAIVWHVIGIALALTIPGAAFLFIVPAVAVTLCALFGASETLTSAVGSCVAAILMFPMALLLYDALGGRLMVAIAIILGILATLFAPLFASLRGAAIVAALAVVCAIVAMLQPAYTKERPRYATEQRIVEGAPPVQMSATRDGERLAVRVRSARGANRLSLRLRGDATVLRVNGAALPPRPARFRDRGPRAIVYGGDEMIVECRARGRVEAEATDGAVEITRAEATY